MANLDTLQNKKKQTRVFGWLGWCMFINIQNKTLLVGKQHVVIEHPSSKWGCKLKIIELSCFPVMFAYRPC